MQKFNRLTIFFILTTLLIGLRHASPDALAAPNAAAPDLRSAASFVVLGASTVTNTGSGTFVGNVGVSPGTEIIGFPPGSVINGAIYRGAEEVPVQAQIDAKLAYVDLGNQACGTDLTARDLGDMTLDPGVYCFDSSAQLTGDLVLDALGDPLAVWVFKMGSTLTTASASSVSAINNGQVVNVYWKVGSSATLGTGTQFGGNIIAQESITLDTGAGLIGRALALNGAVTMDTNGPPNSPPIANTPLFWFYYLPIIMK